jgi:hypothetical protein
MFLIDLSLIKYHLFFDFPHLPEDLLPEASPELPPENPPHPPGSNGDGQHTFSILSIILWRPLELSHTILVKIWRLLQLIHRQ